MHTMNHMILNDIDTIDDCMLEAEINVLTALCDVYEKSAVILENYEGEDYSCFDIFQEGVLKDAFKEAKGSKGEMLIKRILLFIPRLISAIKNQIWKRIINKMANVAVDNLKAVVDAVDRGFEFPKSNSVSYDEKWDKFQDRLDKSSEVIDDATRNNEKWDKFQGHLDKASEVIDEAIRNMGSSNTKIDKNHKETDELVESMVHEKKITTRLDLSGISNLVRLIRDELYELSNAFESTPVYEMDPKLDSILYKYGRHPVWNISVNVNQVRRFFSMSSPTTYSIDEACEFIKGKNDICRDLLSQVEQFETSVNGLIKEEEARLEKDMKKGTPDHLEDADYCKKDLATFKRILWILQSQARVIPMLITIIDEEIETWDEAAKAILKSCK